MIKRILLPLDFTQYTDAALKYACYIAKLQDATITGVVVVHIPGIASAVGPNTKGCDWEEDLDKHTIDKLNKRISLLLDKFNETCQKEGVKHVQAEDQGICAEQVVFQSMFYDIVIAGFKTSYYFDESLHIEVPLGKILSHTITPILAVPKDFTPFNKVLIAFDGSLPAARALQRFSHLANAKDTEIIVLMSHADQDTAFYYLNKAEEYLKAHDLDKVKKQWTNKNIILFIRNNYMDNQVDAFITGISSKGFVKDFTVGSLTKALLREAKKPLFIGQ